HKLERIKCGQRRTNLANLVSKSRVGQGEASTMQDQAVQWDLRSIQVHSSGLSQFFILYILAVFFRGCWKIARAWRILLQRPPGDPGAYIKELNKITYSIGKWTQFTFLLWGFYICWSVGRVCQNWMLLGKGYLPGWSSALHELSSLTAAMLFILT